MKWPNKLLLASALAAVIATGYAAGRHHPADPRPGFEKPVSGDWLQSQWSSAR